MSLTTVFAWLAWLIVVNYIDPETSGTWGLVFFYGSLFLSLAGTLSILSLLLRRLFHRRLTGGARRLVIKSFRQACLWSLAINLALALQSQSLLTWWMMIILLALFVLLELTIVVFSKQSLADHG